MKVINNKNKNTPKILLGISLGIVILLLGYTIAGFATKKLWPFNSQSSSQARDNNDSGQETIPIRSDDQLSDIKDQAENDSKNNESPSNNSQKNVIHVGITYADVYNNNLEVRSFIGGVIEGTGTCTATLEHGGKTITKVSKAFIDSTTTQCEPIYIPVNSLPSTGIWKVKISYDSPTSEGASDVFEVTI